MLTKKMTIIAHSIKKEQVLQEYNNFFKNMIKAVVDVKSGTMAIDAELHADLEEYMLQNGSGNEDLWGINLYLGKEKSNWIEYTALINIRPSIGNNSMEINDPAIRKKIRSIVDRLIAE